MARPPWKPGDLCPKCQQPVYSRAEMYKASHNICRPCGQQARREYLDARKAARPSERHCLDCRVWMSALGTKERCDACVARRRAEGARTGREAMMAKRRQERELREATRGPAEAPRPIAQAWPGLRGPGGEWEHGPTSVQGWATLDGRRV